MTAEGTEIMRPLPDLPDLDAYHTTTEHGERVIVVCPGGETDPLHPDDAEAWAREILRAVKRARDVGDQESARDR